MKSPALKYIATIIPAILVTAAAFTLGLAKIDDYDVWWHLKCGELIVREGWIPRTDIFSYTALGKPWIDGYIFAQILLYASSAIGKGAGVSIFGALLGAAVFAAAFIVSGRDKKLPIAVLVGFAALFVGCRAMFPRPSLFTPLFAVIFLGILERYRSRGGRAIWALIPAMILWANSHPGFFMGPIITGCFLIGSIRDREKRNAFALSIGLQTIATLVNPYGIKIYYSTVSFLFTSELKGGVQEWKYLFDRVAPEPPMTIIAFVFIVLLGVAGIALSWKNRRYERILLFVLVSAMAITAVRNLFLFAALAIPLVSMMFRDTIESRSFGKATTVSNILISLAALFMIWFAATDRFYIYSQTLRSTGLGEASHRYPGRACEFLNKIKVNGNIYNPYAWGGYILNALHPKYKVLIDGRAYPYPYELFKEVLNTALRPDSFDGLDAKYNFSIAFVSLHDAAFTGLAIKLINSPDWAPVVAEPSGILFLKRNSGNDDVIAMYEWNLMESPPDLPTRLGGRKLGIFGRAEIPYAAMWWASLYERLGRPDLAAACLATGLGYLPETKDLRAWLGSLLIKTGLIEDGRAYLAGEMEKNPDDQMALRGMSEYYTAIKDYRSAEETLQKIKKLYGDSAQLWVYLGVNSFNMGDYRLAAERFNESLKLRPNDYGTMLKLARSLERFDPEAAAAVRQRAEMLRISSSPSGQ